MGLISAAVDRLLHTTARQPLKSASARAVELHARTPVVDLVVGSALFRASLIDSNGRGHVDLARLRAGGINVIGLTVATRYPDLRGTLSRHHFRSLGAPPAALASNMALAEWLIGRIHDWCDSSAGALRLLRTTDDLDACLLPGGPIGIFIGVQGGHVLDGDLANVERLRRLGVRMLAPAHIMDNEMVGSGTGRRRGGLTDLGRELIAELERQALLVDLAHMSGHGIADSVAVVGRPPVLSHTGLSDESGAASRWRRYSPATRNVPGWTVRRIADAGGVTGLVLSTRLLGGDSVENAARTFARAVELAGSNGVALGSDMDGGLRMVVDAAGLPLLSDALLDHGLEPDVVRAILGRNALRLLRPALAERRRVPVNKASR